MANESARWVKLWVSSLSDPDIDNLSLEDFGRWCKLLMYVKMHGEKGSFTIKEPARTFLHHMQVDSIDSFKKIASTFPNITVNCNGNPSLHTFIIQKWSKFQVDDSIERVRQYRKSVTVQEKEKDKRKNKKKNTTPKPPSKGFNEFWSLYPKKVGKGDAEDKWNKLNPDDALAGSIVESVRLHRNCKRWKDGYIPNPSTFLSQRRWEDTPEQEDLDPWD